MNGHEIKPDGTCANCGCREEEEHGWAAYSMVCHICEYKCIAVAPLWSFQETKECPACGHAGLIVSDDQSWKNLLE